MKPRVVICRSNPISPDPRVEKEARSLAAVGYPVQVVGWDRSGSLPVTETRDKYSIFRCLIRAQYGHGLQNLPQLIRWQIGLLHWLIGRRNEYDIIHACDFDTILPAVLVKALFKKKVVYDIYDFYADHLRATPDLLKRWIRSTDLWAIGRADGLILADDSRREQVRRSNPKRLEVIYNSPEDTLDRITPDRNGRDGSFRIAYIGLLQVERGLSEVLDVLSKHTQWELDLAGFGGDEAQILEKVKDMPNVRWHGRVPYEQALHLSNAADALFATYDPQIPNHRYSSPNKVFEAMMLGKPVVVASRTNMDRIVTEAGCGLVVEYGSRTELEGAFELLCADEEMRRRLGENGRKAYENRYSWVKMGVRLTGLYQEIEAGTFQQDGNIGGA